MKETVFITEANSQVDVSLRSLARVHREVGEIWGVVTEGKLDDDYTIQVCTSLKRISDNVNHAMNAINTISSEIAYWDVVLGKIAGPTGKTRQAINFSATRHYDDDEPPF